MEGFKTPGSMPRPVFYENQGQMSTKKARQGLKRTRPPKAPEKSTAKLSSSSGKPTAISFRSHCNNSLASPFYDEYTNDNYLNQCFVIESKVGSGDFGDVYKVVSKEDGKVYAIKRTNTRFRGLGDRCQKLDEVRKNESIEPHPNLVRFCKAWEENDHLYMQLEFCRMNLEDYAYKHSDIPERVIWHYMVDLLQALKHIHDHDFIHLDIKPENIFLGTDGRCKLGDFGLAFDMKTQDPQRAVEGDARYLAPELLTGNFTKAADIFSLGMTMLELACDLDLSNLAMQDTIDQIRKGRIPKTCRRYMGDRLFRVLSWMLNPDPTLRPTAQELLDNPYIQYKAYLRRASLVCDRILISVSRFWEKVFLYVWNLFVTLYVIWFKVATPVRTNVSRTPDGHFAKPLQFKLEDTYSDDEFQSFSKGRDSPTCDLSLSLPPQVPSSKSSPEVRPLEISGRTSVSGYTASPQRHLSSTPIKLRTPIRTPMRLRGSKPSTPILEGKGSLRKPSFLIEEGEEDNSSMLPNNSSLLSTASTIEPRNLLMSFEAFSDSD